MSGAGAVARRRDMRAEVRAAICDAALRAYAATSSYEEAAAKLADEFPHLNGTSLTRVKDWVREALDARRIATDEQVELVRGRVMAHLDAILAAWMPLAVGQGLDPATLQPLPPGQKAAETALRTLTLYAQVAGLSAGPQINTQINVTVQIPTDANEKRRMALAALQDEHDKQRTIAGELADAGTTIDQARGANHAGMDRMPAPPTREKP